MNDHRSVRAVTWNVEWATRRSVRGRALYERIVAKRADVVCLTETSADFLTDDGFTITAGPDWGYQAPARRRKVLLWSRRPWSSVDEIGDAQLPPGRFIAALTETELGSVCCVGVCIPWRDAHVRTGKANRKRWEDHLRYLRVLGRALAAQRSSSLILLGDFNQTLPRSGAPEEVHRALNALLGDRLVVATAGLRDASGRLAIDHIAHSPELVATRVEPLSAEHQGKELSDHFGVVTDIALTIPAAS